MNEIFESIKKNLKLGIDEKEVNENIENLLSYGVDSEQIKRTLLKKYGKKTENIQIGEITPETRNVNVIARLLTISKKLFETKDGMKENWAGILGDETGIIRFSTWRDIDELKVGNILRINNTYISVWRGELRLNLSRNTEISKADMDVKFGSERVEFADLKPGWGDITAKVLTIKEGENYSSGILVDNTGTAPFTSWVKNEDEYELKAGDTYRIDGVGIRRIGDWFHVDIFDGTKISPETRAIISPKSESHRIDQLKAGMYNIGCIVRVLSVREQSGRWSGILGDETGIIPFTAWKDFSLSIGGVIDINGAFIREFNGVSSLDIGESAEVIESGEEVPTIEECIINNAQKLTDLGTEDIFAIVLGSIVDVRDGSGIIYRCPECNRTLKDGICTMHNKVDGKIDLRIKAILDDGYGCATIIVNRWLTEKLIGLNLDECIQIAKDHMDQGKIKEYIDEKILLRYLWVAGRVKLWNAGMGIQVNTIDAGLLDVSKINIGDYARKLL